MSNLEDILIKGALNLNIKLKDNQIEQFEKYKTILLEWNEKINLTAITDEKEIYIKHFLDSISCSNLSYIKNAESIIDIGSGAGFPGVPLSILFPEKKITLIDSLNKRVRYLNTLIDELGLKNIDVYHGRAEEFGKNNQFRECYDVAVSRAVARLNILSEFCIPFIKKGGHFICYKGMNIDEEIADGEKAIEILGCKTLDKIKTDIPFIDMKHYLLIIEKIKSTPKEYPRKSGMPAKKPLK